MKRPRLSAHHIIHNSWGFTLFEIFLTILILAIAIVPMMNAFAPALLSSGQGEEQAVLTGCARRTMNRLLDLDFQSLDAKRGNPVDLVTLFGSQTEADKENCLALGTTYPPVVTICATNCPPNESCVYVPDCVTDSSDETRRGPLELTVTLKKNVTLQTLRAAR